MFKRKNLMNKQLFIFVAFLLFSLVVCEGLGGHFGEYIRWRSYEDGMKEIKEKKRPGVVLIHRDWCSACKTIGRYCREDIPLIRMSKKFVMISAPNGEEPQDETFQMDGAYFPRLYFINPDGSVNYDIVGDPQAEKYQFYYSTPEQIIDSMKKMIKDLKAKKQRRKARKEAEEAIPENVDENFQVEDL